MPIPVEEARGIVTNAVHDVYDEVPKVTNFFSGMAEKTFSNTQYVNVNVRRGTEFVAPDVLRGSDGTWYQLDKATQRLYEPPYYKLNIAITEHDVYKIMFNANSLQTSLNESQVEDYIDYLLNEIYIVKNQIYRAYELQASQFYQTGVIQVAATDNFDFNRKSASIVDGGAGSYWNDPTVNPINSIRNAGQFLREESKYQGGMLNVIMGELALEAFLQNVNILERYDLQQANLADIRTQTRLDGGTFTTRSRDAITSERGRQTLANADYSGASYHGVISTGSWTAMVYTYPQRYEVKDAAGNITSIPFLDPEKVLVMPENPRFIMAHAAVPYIKRDERNMEYPEFYGTLLGQVGAAGGYECMIDNYLDDSKDAHIFRMKSAGLFIPTAVDDIVTIQALTPPV